MHRCFPCGRQGPDALLCFSGPLLWVNIDQPKLTPAVKQEWSNKYDVQCRGGVEVSLRLPPGSVSGRMSLHRPIKVLESKAMQVKVTTNFHPAPTKDRSHESERVYKSSKYTDMMDLKLVLKGCTATLPGDALAYTAQAFNNLVGATKHRYMTIEAYLAAGGTNRHAQRSAAWLKHCVKMGKWNPMHLYIDVEIHAIDVLIPVTMYPQNRKDSTEEEAPFHAIRLHTRDVHFEVISTELMDQSLCVSPVTVEVPHKQLGHSRFTTAQVPLPSPSLQPTSGLHTPHTYLVF